FSGLSFLGSAGHGPVVVNYSVNHADGTSEYGSISVSDWFGGLATYISHRRVDVVYWNINNEKSTFSRIYSTDIPVNNTGSQFTSIGLPYVSGGAAAIFAVSGVTVATPPTAPFNLTITPPAQSQYLGGNAFITVTASGTLPLSYQWKSNNVP